MPVTNDIKIFLDYISIEISKYIKELIHDKNPLNFTNLNKLVLAYLIVFNRRREGEVSKLKLATFMDKPDYDDFETDTCQETLSPMEWKSIYLKLITTCPLLEKEIAGSQLCIQV